MPTSTDVDACHKSHVDSVTKEVWKAIGALWRSTRLLTIQSKLMFYFSLIQSKLLYGSNAYFPSITVGVLDRLIRLSKSAIRDYYGLSRWTPTSPTFLALGVRPLASAMTNKIVQFVHRCLIGRYSNLFSQYFVPVSSRATRGSSEQLLVVPFWPGPPWSSVDPVLWCGHLECSSSSLARGAGSQPVLCHH